MCEGVESNVLKFKKLKTKKIKQNNKYKTHLRVLRVTFLNAQKKKNIK